MPPELPAHLIAQQLLALTLQEADTGLGRSTWTEWLGDPPVLGADAMSHADELLAYLLAHDWLHEDEGLLSPGIEAERTIGRRNFLELTSVFVADPLVSVRHGRTEIGQVPDIAVTAAFSNKGRPPALLLAGRTWKINDVDWKRRIVRVEPAEQRGSVRFSGSAQPLSYRLCQAIAEVLDGASLDPVTLTARAVDALARGSCRDPWGTRRPDGAHSDRIRAALVHVRRASGEPRTRCATRTLAFPGEPEGQPVHHHRRRH